VNAGTIINPAGLPAAALVNVPAGASIGTIVNPAGDVILSKNLLINTGGKSLLLLSAGNISAVGVASINLAGTKGSGGSLIALAGYSFSPSTPAHQVVDTSTLYTVTGPSPGGGSINLSGTSINTSSISNTTGGKNGGKVLLIANGGTGSLGT